MKSSEHKLKGERILLRENVKKKLLGNNYLFDKFCSPLVLAMNFPILIAILALFPHNTEKYLLAVLFSYLFFMAFLWIYKLQDKLKSIMILLDLDDEDERENN